VPGTNNLKKNTFYKKKKSQNYSGVDAQYIFMSNEHFTPVEINFVALCATTRVYSSLWG
jgi:hypothetical protein